LKLGIDINVKTNIKLDPAAFAKLKKQILEKEEIKTALD